MFALFYPQGFIMALGYAAIALVILAIFLPVAMVNKVRKSGGNRACYQVVGGNMALMLSALAGMVIVTAQLLISFGVLPALG